MLVMERVSVIKYSGNTDIVMNVCDGKGKCYYVYVPVGSLGT